MNIEQVEGQLAQYKGKLVAVCVPIRGTIHQTFYGHLEIVESWEDHKFILYTVNFWPDADVNFRAGDVLKITDKPTANIAASILLITDEWKAHQKLLKEVKKP